MPSLIRRKSSKKGPKDDETVGSSSSKSLLRRSSSRGSAKAKKGSVKKAASPSTPTKAEQVKKVEVADDATTKTTDLTNSPSFDDESTESKGKAKEEIADISKVPSLDESSTEGSKAETDPSNVLSVVLLLMDTSTRRFELVQLEFDAKRATVADMLSQIPDSVGEDIQKNMKYTGVCTRDGTEMGSDRNVSEFCSGNELFIAIPEGFDGEKTAEQAKPILADSKVADMLEPTGIALPPPQETKDDATEDAKAATPAKKEPASMVDDVIAAIKPKLEEVNAALKPKLQEINAALKPKLQEAREFMDGVKEHVEKSPTKYQFVLIGFLFVIFMFLMYALLVGGAAPASSVDPLVEPVEADFTEEIVKPKNKLFKAVSKGFLKIRRKKDDDVGEIEA
mmetsp:Transcript_15035/g.20480  ORF Transcript_15035/g.20480 Transcript_15035/m.20480 type:complete len:395 (-) Transcript_15035:446-1630(-)|eukprot:CAMPEP_0185728754 /NCGR_PEP_ID=MMETSP1171-20130828/4124_1 /TAXON_ID=374046 /ORGANISM="Helicotheca tamensis, Strain CCMP826" /LENGTH=394 /DNA_ID=CAMNT_0028397495 /DNA_START=64 /DNA_END=1248 /DNA_ORIENTATION=+